MSLSEEKRAERDAAKTAILAYWRQVRGRYTRDLPAARIADELERIRWALNGSLFTIDGDRLADVLSR